MINFEIIIDDLIYTYFFFGKTKYFTHAQYKCINMQFTNYAIRI